MQAGDDQRVPQVADFGERTERRVVHKRPLNQAARRRQAGDAGGRGGERRGGAQLVAFGAGGAVQAHLLSLGVKLAGLALQGIDGGGTGGQVLAEDGEAHLAVTLLGHLDDKRPLLGGHRLADDAGAGIADGCIHLRA